MTKIFLLAGETSGDLHGYKLVLALKKQFPIAHIFGVGGPKMRAAGLDCILPMEKFQVMGFIDVFFALPRLIRQFFFLRKALLQSKPDFVIFIDYPGFNLALAKSLFKRSFKGKICHYICPSVWAWGKGRIPKMERILDHLFVIYPFETPLFSKEANIKLQTHYVGNPLVQSSAACTTPALSLYPKKMAVALFPGSRHKELQRNFPIQLRVAKRLLDQFPDLLFVVSVAQPSFSPLLEKMIQNEGFSSKDQIILLESSQNGALMKRSIMAIAKSGTNNLELALHSVPTIVTYGVGPIDLFIAKNLLRIRLPFYCITNIIGGKEVFPELIGPNFNEESLYFHASRFLSSKEARDGCREKCLEIGKILENKYPEEEITGILKSIRDETRPI